MPNEFGEFEIAKFEQKDFRKLAGIFCDVYAQTYPHFNKKFHKPERFQEILSKNTLQNSRVWTAKHNGEIVGFLALAENHIDQLYILPNYQSKGLGGFWVEQSKTIYSDFLELYTFACNKNAITFYEKHGFKIIEKSIAPDEKMPDVKMRWENLGGGNL